MNALSVQFPKETAQSPYEWMSFKVEEMTDSIILNGRSGDGVMVRFLIATLCSVVLWSSVYAKGDVGHGYISEVSEKYLIEVLKVGDVHRLADYISEEPEIVNRVFRNGGTLLGKAAFFGSDSSVDLLLENGADPNFAGAAVSVPLQAAVDGLGFARSVGLNGVPKNVVARYLNIVETLISSGASTDFQVSTPAIRGLEYRFTFFERLVSTVCENGVFGDSVAQSVERIGRALHGRNESEVGLRSRLRYELESGLLSRKCVGLFFPVTL